MFFVFPLSKKKLASKLTIQNQVCYQSTCPMKTYNVYPELLGCQVRTLPFTYLGMLLGTTRPKTEHF
jgi:hypothetical protein